MDRTLEETIYKTFTTRSFTTGVPTTLAGSPVVSAYENDSLTQITAGITLGVDHDGVTGLNLLTIVASAANGFEAGKDYNLVITTGTVGGVSVVGETVFHFSLSRDAAAVALAAGVTLKNGPQGGAAAVLTLERLVITSTTLNQPAIKATGNGTGAGILAQGGSDGEGIYAQGNGSQAGIRGDAMGIAGSGIVGRGAGAGSGITGVGGPTDGPGISGHGGVGSNGHGMQLVRGGGGGGDDLNFFNGDVTLPWNAAWDAEVESEVTDALVAHAPFANLDVAISTRASQASVDVIDDFLDTEIAAILAAVDTEVAAILAAVTALNNLSAAQVNAEMVDVLSVDTYAEPTGVPAATASIATKIGRIHQALRNKLTISSTKKTFFDDADAALWEKDLSDDGTTYTETEGNAI